MNNTQRPYLLLMLAILVAGGVFRLWNFWDMPFTFDELSALSRTTFDSFSEMIRVGVVEKDSHPAGVQSFLYYWVQVFGTSEMAVKLPFMLAGLASIWLAYKIGELWFNQTAGILTAAYISSLQFFIYYSQVARPYSSGLILTLAMVWFWSRYFFNGHKIKDLGLFVVFGSLSAYNHYISLLFVATVGLSGLLFTNRKNILQYLLSGVVMFLLYLPHLFIFLAQAEKGTIGGWLGQPGRWFILEFFHWLFHYSFFSYMLFILIVITGLFIGIVKPKPNLVWKKRIILLLWLLPTPVFGYIYSYSVEAILQFSLLIFTAPYFFILLFSFSRDFKVKQLAIAVSLIILINGLTLIINREHYHIFYKQAFEQVVENAIELDKGYPDEVFILNDYIPYYSEYYFNKYEKTLPYFSIRNKEMSDEQFDSVVSSIKQKVVITSGLPPDYFHIVKKYFPTWINYDIGFTFEQYTFIKEKQKERKNFLSQAVESSDFNEQPNNWNYDRGLVIKDDTSSSFLYPMTAREWGPLLTFPLDSISSSGYVFIDIVMEVMTDTSDAGGVIVAEIKHGEEQLAWRGKPFTVAANSYQKVSTALDIQVLLANKMTTKNMIVRLYIWNPKKTNFYINRIDVSYRPGNPFRYALFSDYHADW